MSALDKLVHNNCGYRGDCDCGLSEVREEFNILHKRIKDLELKTADAHAHAALEAESANKAWDAVNVAHAKVERLRVAPPAVYLMDIEAAAGKIAEMISPGAGSGLDRAMVRDHTEAILASHTKPIDREGLVNAMHEAWQKSNADDSILPVLSDAVIAYLGAQAAQPVNYNDLAQAIDEGLVRSVNDERPDCDRAADAALAFLGLKSVGRPQTEEEVEALEAAQPVEPLPLADILSDPERQDDTITLQPGPLFRWERDVDGDPIVPAPKPPEPPKVRVETYDQMRAELAALRQERDRMRALLSESREWVGRLVYRDTDPPQGFALIARIDAALRGKETK